MYPYVPLRGCNKYKKKPSLLLHLFGLLMLSFNKLLRRTLQSLLASSLLSPLLGGISGSSSLPRLEAGELGVVKNSFDGVSNTDLL